MAGEYGIEITPTAKKDIENILRYVRSIGTLQSTINTNQLIESGLEIISRMPTSRLIYRIAALGKELRHYEIEKEIQDCLSRCGKSANGLCGPSSKR